jgi:transposase
MKITKEQYEQLKPYLPLQRGNVKVDNYILLNALLYIAENGCKWRALPECYGKWDTIYKRINRWAKSGALEKVFRVMQKKQIVSINVEVLALDSTCIKVHPNGTGALKKQESKASEQQEAEKTQNFMWFPQMIKLS